ncbi:MAG: hypothetical protein NZ839_03295, partial [Endomicrobia bacterium]|nr:hypothetical protein [Endomicrobiia bacterium]
WGADDPFNRKPMLWKELQPYDEPDAYVMEDILQFYKNMCSLRKSLPELSCGLYETLLMEDEKNIYGFARIKQNDITIVVLNNSSDKKQTAVAKLDKNISPPGTKFVQVYPPTEKEKQYQLNIKCELKLTLPQETAIIITKKK